MDLSVKGLKSFDGTGDLRHLRILELSGNDLTDLTPLHSCENLEYIDLSGNPRLKKEEVDTLREKLPNCLILHVD